MLSVDAGIWLALICVRHRGRWPDRLITTASAAAYSIPALVLSALLWGFLAYRWEIFPFEGYVGLTEDPVQWAWHLLLAWIAVAVPFAGAYTHVVRGSLLQMADEDWVRTARAKGLSERRILRRHVLRNALIPPATSGDSTSRTPSASFALYVEVIFGLPGGQLTSETLGSLDLPPMVALAMYLVLVVVVTNALVDIAVAALDPRVRRPGRV